MTKKDILILSTADWDNPFWTNKQHVAVELAKIGHRVLYIDSIGLRRPSSSSQDLKRIFHRITKSFSFPKKVRENLWVLSPIVIPSHTNKFIQKLNRFWFGFLLHLSARILKIHFSYLWTFNPLTSLFVELKYFQFSIYHCVDEIKAQPRMPLELIEFAEKQLLQDTSLVLTTSIELTNSRKPLNPNTFYFPNVCDYNHFSSALDSRTVVPNDLLSIPSPRVGFIGALSGYKIDFSLLRFIAESRPDWSIVLIGKVGEGDPLTDISLLNGLPNLYLMGPRSYEQLPSYLKGFDVGLLPNLINQYTKSMFPMKFFEYLASGTPVVGVELPALKDFEELACLEPTHEKFLHAIEKTLAGDVPDLDARLDAAKKHTYRERTEQMLSLIDRLQNSETEIST